MSKSSRSFWAFVVGATAGAIVGILYAPDYLVNAGGIINCYWEIVGYNRQASLAQAELIYDTTLRIYSASKEKGIPTYLAANQMAEQRIQSIANIKTRH
jgi:leucine dehydrogenase